MSDGWSAATFEGAARAQHARAATSTAEQRLTWLEELLRTAEAAGALARVRARRQREAMALWDGTS